MKEEEPSDLENEAPVPPITKQLAASLASETLAESEAPSNQNQIEHPPTPTQQQPRHEDAEDPAISEVIDEAIAASASPCNDTLPDPSSLPSPPVATATAPLDSAPPTAGDIVPTGQEQTGRWTREEQERFIHALELYGKEWKKVAAAVQTRTIVQVRTHAQKFQKKLARIFEKGGDGEGTEAQLLSVMEVETESVGGRMRLKVDEAELRRLRKLHVLFSTTHGGYGKN